MDEIRSTGKTVDDALTEALIQLGTTSDQVEYDVIEKGSAGFLGIGSKPAVIVVRRKKKEEAADLSLEKENPVSKVPEEKTEKKEAASKVSEEKAEKKVTTSKVSEEKAEKKESSSKAQEEKAEKKEAASLAKAEKEVTPLDGKAMEQKVDSFLKELFRAMEMKVDIQYQIDEANRTVGIDLSGDEMGILIGKRGQTLDSLQYLISLVVNKDEQEYVRIKLDTENYRKRRRATLENLAKNIAYKVKRERKPVTLEPMNPYERRIIHSALQNDRYVETHSEGSEPYRRVVVSLKKIS